MQRVFETPEIRERRAVLQIAFDGKPRKVYLYLDMYREAVIVDGCRIDIRRIDGCRIDIRRIDGCRIDNSEGEGEKLGVIRGLQRCITDLAPKENGTDTEEHQGAASGTSQARIGVDGFCEGAASEKRRFRNSKQ